MALWKYYSVTVFSKFRAAYNKCIKSSLFMQDVTVYQALELGLPAADTIVRNSCVLFASH